MASSRGSSNSPGLLDVVTALQSFEQSNQVTVVLQLRSSVATEKPGVYLVGIVMEGSADSTVPAVLASEKLRCSDTSWATLDTAAFRLLYALDSALAFRELGAKKP